VPLLGELDSIVADAAEQLGRILDEVEPNSGRAQRRLAKQLLGSARPGTPINVDVSTISGIENSTIIVRSTVTRNAEKDVGSEMGPQTLQSTAGETSGGTGMSDNSGTHGDTFVGISNSTIITRSYVVNAFNKLKAAGDSAAAEAIAKATKAVADSGNKDAGTYMDAFNQEVAKPEPSKGVLATMWGCVVKALPTVKEIAEVAGTIAKLFI